MADEESIDAALEERYRRAAQDARALPNDLLSNAQRLKLYALFKQAEGPAPTTAPSRIHAINYAKWEAWNDVRSLSKKQAMESYCAIIEGLTSITKGNGADEDETVAPNAEPTGEEAPPPPPPPPAAAAATPAAPAADAAETPPGKEVIAGAMDGVSDGEPHVDSQKWATSALKLAAGEVFELPMPVLEPSLCVFSFSVNGSDTPCGFSLAQSGKQLVTVRGVKHEGSVELDGGDALLVATIDNLASVFQSISVACTLTVQPLSQLQALEKYREGVKLRNQITETEAALAKQTEESKAIAAEEAALVQKLNSMQEEIKKVQQELTECGGRQVASDRHKIELHAQMTELKKLLETSVAWGEPRKSRPWADADGEEAEE